MKSTQRVLRDSGGLINADNAHFLKRIASALHPGILFSYRQNNALASNL